MDIPKLFLGDVNLGIDVAIDYGDWQYLAMYLQYSDIDIPPRLKKYLIDILLDKIQRPNKPRRLMTHARHLVIASALARLLSEGHAKNMAQAEEMLMSRGVDRSTMQRAWREYEADTMQAMQELGISTERLRSRRRRSVRK